MLSVEESAVLALDGTDKELFPHLPYILQDLWEIGSDLDAIIKAVRKHNVNPFALQLLDLGCGKGAVSIRVAEALGCKCFGIDAIEEFIREAEQKAAEHKVDELCTFVVGDIREMIDSAARYDIVVLGAIGPVFGDYLSTLTRTSQVLEKDGIIIIDDGYIPAESDYTHSQILRRDTILKQISYAGMRLVDEIIIQPENIKSSDDYIFEKIESRCKELICKYPQKKHFFEGYIEKQRVENDVLENRIVCSTIVIKKQ
ncbi:MAG: methyltransferase domain-containing protein [Chitinivibrionales bacterium]|nr:methyltransferase domain-containing protein [Chitinivibrionales bacterium]